MERLPSNGSARSSPSGASGSVVEKLGERASPGMHAWGGTLRNLVGGQWQAGRMQPGTGASWMGASWHGTQHSRGLRTQSACYPACVFAPAATSQPTACRHQRPYFLTGTACVRVLPPQAAISVRTGDDLALDHSIQSGSLADDQYSESSTGTTFAAGGGGGGQGNSVRALLSRCVRNQAETRSRVQVHQADLMCAVREWCLERLQPRRLFSGTHGCCMRPQEKGSRMPTCSSSCRGQVCLRGKVRAPALPPPHPMIKHPRTTLFVHPCSSRASAFGRYCYLSIFSPLCPPDLSLQLCACAEGLCTLHRLCTSAVLHVHQLCACVQCIHGMPARAQHLAPLPK